MPVKYICIIINIFIYSFFHLEVGLMKLLQNTKTIRNWCPHNFILDLIWIY